MTLWFVFALMTAAAIFAALWPLGRRPPLRAGQDVAVYRDQLAEIDRDRETGRLPDAEAEAARIEVSRRLLAAADAEAAAPQTSPPTSLYGRRGAGLAALLAIPVVTAGIYYGLGSPHLPGEPLAERMRAVQPAGSVEQLVSQVEAHLERNPNDGRGWEVLAPVYLRLGRSDDAAKAFERMIALSGETADRRADFGEAQVGAANGIVTAQAKGEFDRALALNPQQPKARFYLGVAAEQDGKRQDAAAIWRKLIADAPPGTARADGVREALARLEGTQAAAAPGPSADDMAAAQSLTPQQRTEMISGMVARLADRLKNDGSDADGWLRLIRAYMVLGERDKARAALSDARRALAGEPDKMKQIDALSKSLGIEG